MLNTNIEFRKGVLFIRLDGILNKNTINDLDSTYNLIVNNGIKNIVFNINEIVKIDKVGINKLFNIYKKVVKNNLNCYFIKNKLIKNKEIKEFDNELKAMEVIWN